MGERLPMFPLNNGLFPGALLPLRVFEPRYLSMIDACLDATSEFGVVLIRSRIGSRRRRRAVRHWNRRHHHGYANSRRR